MADRQPLSATRMQLLQLLGSMMSWCHNPNNGKHKLEEEQCARGREFPYPVYFDADHLQDNPGNLPILPDGTVDPEFAEGFMAGYLGFGSNHLLLYKNLNTVLEYLEMCHGL